MAHRALLIFLLSLTSPAPGSGYWGFKDSHSPGRSSFRAPPATWQSDWAAVSEVFSPAPPAKLDVKWTESQLVEPGETVPVTVMTSRPTQLRWNSERGALYTIMLLDAGIS